MKKEVELAIKRVMERSFLREESEESFRFPACLFAAIFHALRRFTLDSTQGRWLSFQAPWYAAVFPDLVFIFLAGIFGSSRGQRSARQSGAQPGVHVRPHLHTNVAAAAE